MVSLYSQGEEDGGELTAASAVQEHCQQANWFILVRFTWTVKVCFMYKCLSTTCVCGEGMHEIWKIKNSLNV